MIAKPIIFDSFAERQIAQGDVMGGAETFAALTTVGAGTLTAALLASSLLTRTGPTGAFTDTTDTSANIINQILPNSFVGTGSTLGGVSSSGGVQNGTTWRLRYVNTVAYAMTLAAGTGVTLGTNPNVNASSVKDYLIQVTNGTPQFIASNCSTTSGSAVISGMTQTQTNQVTVGQLVSGSGIPASTTVIGITPGSGVTLSNNATATATGVVLTFNPTVTITGIGQGLL